MSRLLLVALALAAATTCPHRAEAQNTPTRQAASREGTPYALREDAMRYADELAERRSLDAAWTRQAISQAQLLPGVVRLMQPAPRSAPKGRWR